MRDRPELAWTLASISPPADHDDSSDRRRRVPLLQITDSMPAGAAYLWVQRYQDAGVIPGCQMVYSIP